MSMTRRITRLEDKVGPRKPGQLRWIERHIVEATPEGPRYPGVVYVREIGGNREQRKEFRRELEGLPAGA